jgi:hypothetical protein
LTFVGLSDGETDGLDAGDTDMPFEIFTLRNLINFFYLDLAGQEFLLRCYRKQNAINCVATIVGLLFVGIFFY